MIIDKIENARRYFQMGDVIKTTLEYLQKTDFLQMAPGKYELETGVRISILRYETMPGEKCRLEGHKSCLDVQYMAFGKEKIGYCQLPAKGVTGETRYDAQRDVMFYRGEGAWLPMDSGMFAILFPGEIHAPKAMCPNASNVIKVVAKIPLSKV